MYDFDRAINGIIMAVGFVTIAYPVLVFLQL